MHQLLYVSSATRKMSDEELGGILASARANNARNGITGMLLHIDGNFLQILEGAESAVQRTFDRIREDPRHSGVSVLLRREVNRRTFHDWSMGFERLSRADSDLNGQIFRISEAAIKGKMSPDAPCELLTFLNNFSHINAPTLRAEV